MLGQRLAVVAHGSAQQAGPEIDQGRQMGLPILDLGGKDGAQHGVVARRRVKSVNQLNDFVFGADIQARFVDVAMGEGRDRHGDVIIADACPVLQ